ncbi:YceI family protein [Flexithrix dorotheae]|uniref:YceI family protein n=1 Tax=Flexithrix dorotheae TaxID=70993 RepID=UPI00035EA00B|nr:YceI family protein [Flexithrix dorotheae]
MKKFNLTLFIFSFILFLISCDKKASDNEGGDESQSETTSPVSCTYSYLKDSTTVEWTAFKLTEKVGVGGKFDEFKVLSAKESGSPKELLNGLEFSIETGSVNTENPIRDQKIVESFFGTLTNTGMITGKVAALEGDDNSGKATVNLTLNEIEKVVELAYAVKGEQVYLEGEINVGDWDGMAAIDALNKVCLAGHTGTDGVSKLWPDVELNISSKLVKNCPN